MARRTEALTMQNAQYQADLTRLQGIRADMISRFKAAAEMDAVFGSLEAVERQENKAELFSAAAARRSLEEENLLALATALPKQLSDQRCKLEQPEAELS
jgi:citrate lyase synthetase